jgi:3-dehydroquinate synthetase
MSYISVSVAAVGALTGVYSAVSQSKQGSKAMLMQNITSQIEQRQKVDLEKALQKTNDQNTKLKILADSVSNIKSAQNNAVLTQAMIKDQADKRNLVIVGIGGGVIVVGALAVLKLA